MLFVHPYNFIVLYGAIIRRSSMTEAVSHFGSLGFPSNLTETPVPLSRLCDYLATYKDDVATLKVRL